MMAHAGGSAATDVFSKLMEISTVSRFDILGEVSDDARGALEGGGTV
jgi:hypothetical protein